MYLTISIGNREKSKTVAILEISKLFNFSRLHHWIFQRSLGINPLSHPYYLHSLVLEGYTDHNQNKHQEERISNRKSPSEGIQDIHHQLAWIPLHDYPILSSNDRVLLFRFFFHRITILWQLHKLVKPYLSINNSHEYGSNHKLWMEK